MKNRNPFFTIGTVGMIVTSVLHIVLALVLNLPSVNATFFILYPVFMAFMAAGFMQVNNSRKKLIPIRVKK